MEAIAPLGNVGIAVKGHCHSVELSSEFVVIRLLLDVLIEQHHTPKSL